MRIYSDFWREYQIEDFKEIMILKLIIYIIPLPLLFIVFNFLSFW